ncbi:MAG: tetraacyldisaccharide 4'-kinase, partial [Phycisphaerales bacterium]|nr:tetraacyldisaccharide 4'-kinase [Phycisphaerales bacterium]
VLDDGFQHRRIARQLDLVLIDASRDPFEDRCLPAGWLREPVEALSRASGVLLTHTELSSRAAIESLSSRLVARTGHRPLAEAEHAWSSMRVADEDVRPGWLGGKRVVAVCAIGHPEAFVRAVEQEAGRPLAEVILLRDHDPYSRGTVERVLRAASGCDAVVTTEKDWAKLRCVPTERWPCPVARPRLEMRLTRRGDAVRRLVLDAAAT